VACQEILGTGPSRCCRFVRLLPLNRTLCRHKCQTVNLSDPQVSSRHQSMLSKKCHFCKPGRHSEIVSIQAGFRPAELKFQPHCSKWHKVECPVHLHVDTYVPNIQNHKKLGGLQNDITVYLYSSPLSSSVNCCGFSSRQACTPLWNRLPLLWSRYGGRAVCQRTP